MTIVIMAGAVIVVVALILAVCDVFWPFSVALALSAVAVWWLGHSVDAWRLVRPEFAAAYFAVGFVWVFFKWTRVVEKAWRLARDSRAVKQEQKPPRWSDHSYDFAAYFFYWPLDMAAYVLSDLMRDAWRFISTVVGRSFDRYAEWRFSSVSK